LGGFVGVVDDDADDLGADAVESAAGQFGVAAGGDASPKDQHGGVAGGGDDAGVGQADHGSRVDHHVVVAVVEGVEQLAERGAV